MSEFTQTDKLAIFALTNASLVTPIDIALAGGWYAEAELLIAIAADVENGEYS